MDEKDKDKKALLSIGEAADYLGVSIDTLRRWEKKEKIEAYRSPGGHRYFKIRELDELFGKKYERKKETEPRKRKKIVVEEKVVEQPIPVVDKPVMAPDRQPRDINIPSQPPVRIIKEQPSPFQVQSETMQPQQIPTPPPAPPQESVLTPPARNTIAKQPSSIKSVPPSTPPRQNVSKKSSSAWVYAVIGLIMLIIGFSIFIIFRSPAEVISPIT